MMITTKQRSIRNETISHHTYAHKQDKSHTFILRRLSKGKAIVDIKEYLVENYIHILNHVNASLL